MPTRYSLIPLLWCSILYTAIACQYAEKTNSVAPENSLSSNLLSDSIPLLKDVLSEDSITFYRQYDTVKNKINTERMRLYQAYQTSAQKDSILIQAGYYFHQAIVQNLLPFWYGTTWDFNGYTAVPRQGNIACGYLVSTTLRQAGIQINRYKLAQQASAVIVKNTCHQIQTIQGFPNFINTLRSLADGLYILGLDNHVGYISIEHGTAYFLHSSYLTPGKACREPISTATVLLFSNNYVLGNISQNKTLIKAWLTGQSLPVLP